MNSITLASRALKISRTKQALIGLVLAAVIIFPRTTLAASPAPVDLKSAAHFAVLATSTTTTTGGGIINGDVGLYPFGSQGIPTNQINGTVYNGGPIAQQAQLDLTAAYNDASTRNANRITLTDGENIGGLTLPPGLYWSASSIQITGDVTFDAGGDPNAVWIIQIGSTLVSANGAAGNPASRVLLTGGAQSRNIFWQVGSSATLGSYSVFAGTIMASASITMMIGSTTDGRALAENGAVTFNGNNGTLSTPAAPVFTGISKTTTNATIVLNTTPYFLVTLQANPILSRPNWTTIATNTPVTNIWTFTDTNATTTVPQSFYRAFITVP
jgi:ice-binding like protein